MRPAEAVRRSAAYLARRGVQSPTSEAEALLMSVMGTTRAGLYARGDDLETRVARAFGRILRRRVQGVPLQYLTGEQQFMDLTLMVEPGVFIPRPETEELALAALRALDGRKGPVLVDLCTGTGAVALAVKSWRPDATVLASDISVEAAALARSNAARLGLAVDVRTGDLFESVPVGLTGRVDVIASNPPYVTPQEYPELPPEVRAEPYRALVGGTEIIARLAIEAPRWLRGGGWLLVEVGAGQAGKVTAMFQGARLRAVEVLQDLAGRDRIVQGRRWDG